MAEMSENPNMYSKQRVLLLWSNSRGWDCGRRECCWCVVAGAVVVCAVDVHESVVGTMVVGEIVVGGSVVGASRCGCHGRGWDCRGAALIDCCRRPSIRSVFYLPSSSKIRSSCFSPPL